MRMEKRIKLRSKIFGRTFERTLPLTVATAAGSRAEIVLIDASTLARPFGPEQVVCGQAPSVELAVPAKAVPIAGRLMRLVKVRIEPTRLVAVLECGPGALAALQLPGQSVTTSYQPTKFTIENDVFKIGAITISAVTIRNPQTHNQQKETR